MTVATFRDIRKKILNCIDQSNECILVSVAWFTSKDLLGRLIDKVESGCKVEIIISDHYENQRLSFHQFREKGGRIFILQSRSSKFLHDKFALFDNKSLIAGSYNWTNSAEFYNHEFVIHSNEPQLLQQFNIRFNHLKKIVTEYDKQKLIVSNNLTAETKEEEFLQLENELLDELLQSIDFALQAGAKIDRHIILDQIYRYGGIGAANRLLKEGTEKLHSGLLKLYEVNRLDLTIESIVLKDKYRALFSREILDKAQQRLDVFKT